MDIIDELESEFEALRTAPVTSKLPEAVQVDHLGGTAFLTRLVVGKDFIAGLASQGLLVIPNGAVLLITANAMPESQKTCLSDLLAAQRNPVRVHFSQQGQARKGWLLSEHGPWLRIAAEQRVVWCPVSVVMLIEVSVVENL